MNQASIDILQEHCRRLIDACEAVIATRFPLKSEDDLGFMVAVFAPVQLDHLRAVTLLVKAGLFGQATIVARSMLEGFAYLYWANESPIRARNWRAYSLVHDLKLLRRLAATGKTVDVNIEPDLLSRLKSSGQQFLKKKARNEASSGSIEAVIGDSSNYHGVWHVDEFGNPVPVSDIIEAGLRDESLKKHYFDLSAHTHWRVDGIGRYIKLTTFGSELDTRSSPADGATALATAFQSCVQVFALLVVHFSISEGASLQNLKQEYVDAVSKCLEE